MKQITNRAVSVLLLAAFVIVGTLLYVIRFVDHGQDWAAAYSRENACASGALIDRNGVVLASYSPYESLYHEDEELRRKKTEELRAFVLANHTYDLRAGQLMEWIWEIRRENGSSRGESVPGRPQERKKGQ